MTDRELHELASEALASMSVTVDDAAVNDALGAVRGGATFSLDSHPPRRRWAAIAAAAIAILGAGVIGYVIGRDSGSSVRTDRPTVVTDASDPSTPGPTTVPAKAPTASEVPATTVGEDTAPTANQPGGEGSSDAFSSAQWVRAGPDGIQLTIDHDEWLPTGYTEPVTGPAYLVRNLVVFQNVDPDQTDTTSGAITVVTADGTSEWEPPAGDPGEYRLHDAAIFGGTPTMLLSRGRSEVLAVDPVTGAVSQRWTFNGQEVTSAAFVDGFVAALVSGPQSANMVALYADGTKHGFDSIAERQPVRVTAYGPEIFGYAPSSGSAGLSVAEYSSPEPAWVEYPDPAADIEARPCQFPYRDDELLWCTNDEATYTYSPYSMHVASRGEGTIRPRRDWPPPKVELGDEAFRPWIDSELCAPVSAVSGRYTDRLLRPFALSRAGWHRFQIIADPALEQNGPWALVGAIPDQFGADLSGVEVINGWRVRIDVVDRPGGLPRATAMIDLGGDVDGYVRAAGLDRDGIIALIESLTPREDTGASGFDVGPIAGLPDHEVVIDRGDEPVSLTYSVFTCTPTGGGRVLVAAMSGDPLAEYVATLDQPGPVRHFTRGDSVVSILDSALTGSWEEPITADDVTEAPLDEWNALPDDEGLDELSPRGGSMEVLNFAANLPWVDPAVCRSMAAIGGVPPDRKRLPLNPFMLARTGWHRFQVFADPALEQNGAWAVIAAHPDDFSFEDWAAAADVERINGWAVRISRVGDPDGLHTLRSAAIDLGGDVDAYVRAVGFDDEQFRALIAALEINPAAGAVNGFEPRPIEGMPNHEIVIDAANRWTSVSSARLTCDVGEQRVHIQAVDGDPLGEYVWPLDRPGPLEVFRRDGIVFRISPSGLIGPDDVVPAPPDAWAALPDEP